MKIALIQMQGSANKAANFANAQSLMLQAIEDGAQLLVLPEMWNFVGGSVADKLQAAEKFPDGESYQALQSFARTHQVWLHGGSVFEKIPNNPHKTYNTTVVFNPQGDEVARYRKIHLFDVMTPGGLRYGESDSVAAGAADDTNVVVYEAHGLKIGCAICYDLRFAELFIKLAQKDVDVIILPAAFTLQTGKDHWEVLCRARAIETQAWFAACGMTGSFVGENNSTRHVYGNSLIADPWGQVVARASEGEGYVVAKIAAQVPKSTRAAMPTLIQRVLS